MRSGARLRKARARRRLGVLAIARTMVRYVNAQNMPIEVYKETLTFTGTLTYWETGGVVVEIERKA